MNPVGSGGNDRRHRPDGASADPVHNTLTIGARVGQVRQLANLTQEQLAHRMHVSVSLVRHVEQGRKSASTAFVRAAARVLGVAVSDLGPHATEYWVDPAQPPKDEGAALQVMVEILVLQPEVAGQMALEHVEAHDGVCGECGESWPCSPAYTAHRAQWLARIRCSRAPGADSA